MEIRQYVGVGRHRLCSFGEDQSRGPGQLRGRPWTAMSRCVAALAQGYTAIGLVYRRQIEWTQPSDSCPVDTYRGIVLGLLYVSKRPVPDGFPSRCV
jgi:hypothetical protein